jgi:hypothetical protein
MSEPTEVYSYDGEDYHHSVDEVVERALDCVDPDEETPPVTREIYVAQERQRTFADYANPVHFIEAAQELAYEEADEYVDDWLEHVTPEAVEELHGLLNAWATRHGHQPTFYTVTRPRRAMIEIVNANGDWKWSDADPETSTSSLS